MNINSYKFNAEGLNHFFGPLEAKIMEVIWDNEEIGIKEVQTILSNKDSINFNTINTVMNRLTSKGFLRKKIVGKRSIFYSTQTKDDFLIEQTKVITDDLIHEFGDLVVNHMVDSFEKANPKLLEELEKKLTQLKARENNVKNK